MIEILVLALAAAVAAGLVTDLTVPLVSRAAFAVRALDYPGGRKHQTTVTPRLGGVAIAGGVAFGGAGVALAMAGILVFLVGVVDDVIGVSSFKKFGVQVLAAILLVRVDWTFDAISIPGTESLHLGIFGPVLTVLWIVGVTNAVNLIDGLDGLAVGVVGIIAASLLGYALLLGNPGTVILMAAMTGACVGFVRHNWAPAKIFMGDSGSLTLGFLLGAMTVHSSLKAPAAIAIVVPVLALGLPVLDTLLVMGVRFLSRPHGRVADRLLAMFHADRNHLHHLLLHHGKSRGRVVAWIYGVVITFCVLALIVALTRNPTLGLFVLAVEGLVIVLLRRSGMARLVAERSRQQRDELRTELEIADLTAETSQGQVVAFREQRRSELR
jgi:UDP-GlcNAc:undecaprenyl-phosphate GlcNAc-1-phosphate transferase